MQLKDIIVVMFLVIKEGIFFLYLKLAQVISEIQVCVIF